MNDWDDESKEWMYEWEKIWLNERMNERAD